MPITKHAPFSYLVLIHNSIFLLKLYSCFLFATSVILNNLFFYLTECYFMSDSCKEHNITGFNPTSLLLNIFNLTTITVTADILHVFLSSYFTVCSIYFYYLFPLFPYFYWFAQLVFVFLP